MSDLFDDGVSAEDFSLPGDDERMGRTAVAAPEPAAVEETPEPEVVVDGPLRNADGTFAAKPDEAAAAEVTQQPGETTGDYESRVAQLEQRLADKDEFIGRLTNEVGESRKMLEEIRDRKPEAAPVQITSDMIEANPSYAAQLAYEQDNGVAFQQALEAWKFEDPFAAATWVSGKQNEIQFAELRREQDARIAQLQAQVQPAAEASQQQLLVSKVGAVAAEFPGLDKMLEDGTIAKVAADYPTIGNDLIGSDPDRKTAALRAAAEIARGRFGDTLEATAEQVARKTAGQAQTARDEAFVASTTTTTTGTKPSRADEIGAEWDAMERPFNEGWNV